MILPISELLRNDPEVKRLTNGQVYLDLAPLNTTPPYIVWQEISGRALNNLDCAASADHIMYQVMCYGKQVTASEVREAARKVLEEHSYILNSRINTYEPNTKLAGRGFDANWILVR